MMMNIFGHNFWICQYQSAGSDDVIVLNDDDKNSNSNEELEPVNILTTLETNNNVNETIPKGIEAYIPIVKLEKMSTTQIYQLTKHRDHQQNLRAFLRQKRNEKRVSQDFTRKKRRREDNDDVHTKWQALQQFLEYQAASNKLLMYPDDLQFYRPKRRHYSEVISRYSIDRSETSSLCGSSVCNENYRPRRSLSSPKRFKFDTFSKSETKARRKLMDTNVSYVVEQICGINVINYEIFFLVKWKHYSSKDNTWEPMENVRNCEKLVLEYVNKELNSFEDEVEKVMKDFFDAQKDTVEDYKNKLKSDVMKEIVTKFDAFEFRCSQLIYMYVKDYATQYLNFKKRFRQLIVLNHFLELDKQQKAAHDKLRAEIMEKEMNQFQIYIENNVDFTIFESFDYTRDNILPKNVNFTVGELKTGCKCAKSCDRTSNCCPKFMKSNFAYGKYVDSNRLRLYNSQMIYECNDYCNCDKNCLNRLTQQPRKIPCTIFKTKNGRGWGLKAVKTIPRGSYIIEYTGEIIDQEESIRRGSKYDEIGKSYLFDLDFNEKSEAVYTIDAAHYGNLARLINHSCEPNCRIWPVATCNYNASIYRLCIFTTRKIKSGEELTIDYSGGAIISDEEDEKIDNGEFLDVTVSVNISHKHKTLDVCKCGSKFCKGKIFA